MRTMHGRFCSAQLREAAADRTKAIDKRITCTAAIQPPLIFGIRCACIIRKLRDPPPDRFIYAARIYFRKQAAPANRLHCSVTAATAQGGSVRYSLPSFSSAGCG